MKTLVMIFLKAPRPGTVKTRLGRELGVAEATAVYRELAEQQVRRMPVELSFEIHYAPRGALAEMKAWLGPKGNYRAQSAGDLGRRLSRAFDGGFRRGFEALVAIGADCPGLDGAVLREAVALLDKSDVVLGPAGDGGYYLVALRRPAPRLFEDIDWSTPAVLPASLERIRECGLSHALLPVMDDVDTLTDWRRHLAARREDGARFHRSA